MTRKKVDLTYITSDSKRKATFKKRKNGLIKKVDEISTLCGIEACAIIYSPNEPQPEVWPSPWGVRRVLSKFRKMPELEQSKKMLNQESLLRQRIMKAQEQLKKQKNDNRKKEMGNLMFQCLSIGKVVDDVSMVDLNDLSWLIDQNLKEIERKITRSQGEEGTQLAANGATVMNGEKARVDDQVQGLETNMVGAMRKQHWSMDFVNDDGDVMLPFGDVNLPNGIWPSSSVP